MTKLRLILTACLTSAVSNAKTVYTNFNWIDPIEQITHADMMLIEAEGFITYLGPKKEFDKTLPTIDFNNKYVIAGFIDTHTHITLGAIEFIEQDGQWKMLANNSDDIAQHNGKMLLAHGITDIRNPGGRIAESVKYKNKVKAGEWIGPDAFVSGELLDATVFDGLSQGVKNAEEIEAQISSQKTMGVDFIKLYTGLDETLLEAAIKSAHHHNMKAVAHLENIPWNRAAQLGLDGVVHAMPISPELLTGSSKEKYLNERRPGAFSFFEWYEAIDFNTPLFKQFIQTLKQQGTSIDPTLIVFHNTFWGDQAEVIKHPKLNLAHPELLQNWQSFFTFNVGWQAADFNRAKAVWPKVQKFIQLLNEADVELTVGTDMNNPWVIPGVSFHQEMQLLVEAGISTYDVLKMATWNGAQAIDQTDKKGSLAAGKYANFVVLENNPVADIKNTEKIYAVVKAGEMYQPQQLIESTINSKQ